MRGAAKVSHPPDGLRVDERVRARAMLQTRLPPSLEARAQRGDDCHGRKAQQQAARYGVPAAGCNARELVDELGSRSLRPHAIGRRWFPRLVMKRVAQAR